MYRLEDRSVFTNYAIYAYRNDDVIIEYCSIWNESNNKTGTLKTTNTKTVAYPGIYIRDELIEISKQVSIKVNDNSVLPDDTIDITSENNVLKKPDIHLKNTNFKILKAYLIQGNHEYQLYYNEEIKNNYISGLPCVIPIKNDNELKIILYDENNKSKTLLYQLELKN